MTGIIIVTHGKLSQALLATAEMIMGSQQSIGAIAFETGQDVLDLQEKICQKLKEIAKDGEALILVDLLGGSPYNAAAMLAMTMPKVKVVTGVNLPMLLGILPGRDVSSAVLSQMAVTAGQSGVSEFVIPNSNTK
jgi:PTS system mannose-specific IIA component